jgi:flagellar basal-body rod protein FlgF
MDKMIFTVLNGMQVTERRQANTFNELANVNTIGFKSSFDAAIISKDLTSKDTFDSRAFPGLTAQNVVDLEPGPMMRTNHDLDLFISDKGLFAVQANDGTEVYTRRGDLKITANGVLTTGKGNVVLGDNGPITLPDAAKIQISPDGVVNGVFATDDGMVVEEVARLKLVNAEDQVIQIREDGLYQTLTKEPLPADAQITVTTGALEGSSASAVDVLVQMIKDSREYEMQVKVVKNAKEMATASASMIRLDS